MAAMSIFHLTDPPYMVHIPFAADMRRTIEIGRRLQAWVEERGGMGEVPLDVSEVGDDDSKEDDKSEET
jgi:hypothetical protein